MKKNEKPRKSVAIISRQTYIIYDVHYTYGGLFMRFLILLLTALLFLHWSCEAESQDERADNPKSKPDPIAQNGTPPQRQGPAISADDGNGEPPNPPKPPQDEVAQEQGPVTPPDDENSEPPSPPKHPKNKVDVPPAGNKINIPFETVEALCGGPGAHYIGEHIFSTIEEWELFGREGEIVDFNSEILIATFWGPFPNGCPIPVGEVREVYALDNKVYIVLQVNDPEAYSGLPCTTEALPNTCYFAKIDKGFGNDFVFIGDLPSKVAPVNPWRSHQN